MRHRMWATLAVLAVFDCACSGYPKDESAEWRLLSSDPASSSLKIRVGFGGCSDLQRVEVDETEDQVTLEAIIRTTGDDCPAVLLLADVPVALTSPLGDRRLRGGCSPGPTSGCVDLPATGADPASG